MPHARYADVTATLYVSQKDGNDGLDGRASDRSFASVPRALEEIKTMRAAGQLQPVTVYIAGDYYLTDTLRIGPGVRGVTLASLPGQRARFIGGRRLEGFFPDTFNGTACLSLSLPSAADGSWHFTDLYVNGRHAALSRFPRTGTWEAVTTERPRGCQLFDGSSWFIAKPEDMALVSGVENALISFCHYWIDEHTPVKSYDPATGRIDMLYPSRFAMTADYENHCASDLHYRLENVPEGFGDPGSWYLDVPAGRLYYAPLPGEHPDTLEVFAPVCEKLLVIEGTEDEKASGITLDGLDFIVSRGEYVSTQGVYGDNTGVFASDPQSVQGGHGAVELRHAADCAVLRCGLSCLGVHGLNIDVGCRDILVEGCTLTELGAGGIRICGSMKGPETSHVTVRGCVLERGGRRYAAGCGVLVCHADHIELTDNEIGSFYYTGISVGWIWGYAESRTHHNRITRNHIHDLGRGVLSDMGGIYLLGRQEGTVLAGNVIHGVQSSYYGGWGIYPDEGSSFLTIRGNIIYDTKCESFHEHYGSFNVVRGNLFADSGLHVVRLCRLEDHLSVLFEENTMISSGVPVYEAAPDGIAARNNVLVCPTASLRLDDAGRSLAEWQAETGHDTGTEEQTSAVDVRAEAEKRIEEIRRTVEACRKGL